MAYSRSFVLVLLMWAWPAMAQFIREYPVPPVPMGISAGPDGNLWIASYGANGIVRMTPEGAYDVFPLSNPCDGGANSGCQPERPVLGPDGAMWFAESNNSMIGRVDMAGNLSEALNAPTWENQAALTDLTFGGDGAIWAVSVSPAQVRQWTPTSITIYRLPDRLSSPVSITTAPDGSVWFTEHQGQRIGHMTLSGGLTEYPIPTARSFPTEIVVSGDGSSWFTVDGGRIGHLLTDGTFEKFDVPTPDSGPWGIAIGPDGCIWFTEYHGNAIGRLDPRTGVISEYPLPPGERRGAPTSITAGPLGRMWFTESNRHVVGSIDISMITSAAAPIPTLSTIGLLVLGAALAAAGVKVIATRL